jgi:hypothetical protein
MAQRQQLPQQLTDGRGLRAVVDKAVTVLVELGAQLLLALQRLLSRFDIQLCTSFVRMRP